MSLDVDLRHRVGDFPLTAAFTVGQGVSVLFGRSGVGKSTLLHLIAGLAMPSAGSITLHGRTLTDVDAGLHLRAQNRRIGMVFQQPLLLPHRTALVNVALAVRSSDRRERSAQARRWLERVGVAELADRRPGQLSGGQQQRVALARALAGDPDLLLLDEPFSSLDAGVRARLGGLVRELVEHEGLTALFVTHDRQELGLLAERVVLAGEGTITEVVQPEVALRRLGADGDGRAG